MVGVPVLPAASYLLPGPSVSPANRLEFGQYSYMAPYVTPPASSAPLSVNLRAFSRPLSVNLLLFVDSFIDPNFFHCNIMFHKSM